MSAVDVPLANRKLPATAAYLSLSTLTGVIELGCVLYAARSGWSLGTVALIGFLYQVASLLVEPFHLPPRQSRLVLATGLVAGIVATISPAGFAPATLLIAIGLQAVRDEQLATVTVATLPKRCARIIGFLIAAAFQPAFLPVIAVLVLAVATSRPAPADGRGWKPNVRFHRHSLLMVVHQTHYFTYAYVLLFALVQLYAPSSLSAAIAFALGWISYTAAPVLFHKAPPLPLLVVGHVLVTAMLAVMASTVGAALPFTLAWIVGGLGGGTVFCIKTLARRSANPPDHIEAWENIGHVAGAGVAVVTVYLMPLTAVFLVAAVFAAATAVGAVVIDRLDPPRSVANPPSKAWSHGR